jgi:hypothetical protein
MEYSLAPTAEGFSSGFNLKLVERVFWQLCQWPTRRRTATESPGESRLTEKGPFHGEFKSQFSERGHGTVAVPVGESMEDNQNTLMITNAFSTFDFESLTSI